MKTFVLLTFLIFAKIIHGQEIDYSTFKQHVFGLELGVALDIGHSKSFKYTYRAQPRIGFSLEYMRMKVSGMTSKEGSKHLLLSCKLTTKATKRFQLYLTPIVGLGFYEAYDDNSSRDKLLDFGGALGLDIHLFDRFILSTGYHVHSNFALDLYLFNSIGLAYKF
ncbi:MAG: hypothetical protein PHQ74_07550 [Crocinitomicaceae bacterium]|nr:hypothetical protein [Crocinitomicaceae bacterium]